MPDVVESTSLASAYRLYGSSIKLLPGKRIQIAQLTLPDLTYRQGYLLEG